MGLYVICNMDFLVKYCKGSDMWKEIQKSVEDADAIDNGLVVKCQMHQKEQVNNHQKCLFAKLINF